MYYNNTIGKNFDTTARLIDDPKSEYYVPWPADTMTFETLQANQTRLYDQITMWADKLVTANNKEVANINKIIDLQQKKADAYEAKITALAPGGPANGGNPDPKQPAAKNKILLYAGIALLAFVILKKA